MSSPFLLIGVGTGGLRVLENVQRYYYEMTGKNKPENVEYLFLETDETAQPELTPLKNEIERVVLDVSQRDTLIEGLKKNEKIDRNWIPNTGLVLEAGKGANGFSAFGRIGLWGGENLNNFIGCLQNAHSRLRTHTNEADGAPIIYITGSLTGGTGSGTFIDVAYLVQYYIGVRNIHGLFLIPASTDDTAKLHKELRNTLTALRALDYVTKKAGEKYDVVFPNQLPLKSQHVPFELVQVISREYHLQEELYPALRTVESLQKIAGLHIFLNTLGFHDKRASILSNAYGGDISHYTTFGLSAIQYPKSQLEEFVAIGLSTELIQRWISDVNVFDKGAWQEISNSRANRKHMAVEKLEEILNEAFSYLDGVQVAEGRNILADLNIKTEELNRGPAKHSELSDYDFVTKLFSSNVDGKYYQILRDNVNNSTNFIIEAIHDYIEQSLEEHECLGISLIELDGIYAGIESCKIYWRQQLELSGNAAKWETVLERQSKWILKDRHSLIGEENNVVADRMKTTLDMLKIHLLINRLIDIQYAIENGKTPDGRILRCTIDNGKLLPTKVKIREVRLLSTDFLASKSEFTFNSRTSKIMRDIKDETLPILRIYKNNDFETEAGDIRTEYNRRNGKVPSKKSVVSGMSLWSYLIGYSVKQDLPDKLYRDTIRAFAQELRVQGAVKDLDIVAHLQRNEELYIKMSRRALAPMIKINRNQSSRFVDSPNIPVVVVSTDENTVSRILQTFEERNHHAFKNTRNKYIDAQLKNIVVFYAERGKIQDGTYRTFEPLEDIYYVPEAKDLYDRYVNAPDTPNTNMNREQKLKIANPYRYHDQIVRDEVNSAVQEKK